MRTCPRIGLRAPGPFIVPGSAQGSARAILGDMLNLDLMPTLVFLFSFLFLYFAVRLSVHHGMRDFTRREAAQRR
jgi:hypothetical protein